VNAMPNKVNVPPHVQLRNLKHILQPQTPNMSLMDWCIYICIFIYITSHVEFIYPMLQ